MIQQQPPEAARSALADAGELPTYCDHVRPEWVDYNGHMNVAYYVLVFDHATDAALDYLHLGAEYRAATGRSVFVGEMHVTYRREVVEGDLLQVCTRLRAVDAKRLVLFHEMYSPAQEGLIASNEVLCVHVDLADRRSQPWPPGAAAMLVRRVDDDLEQPPPADAGRRIDVNRDAPRKP